jgi:hypothetical protein
LPRIALVPAVSETVVAGKTVTLRVVPVSPEIEPVTNPETAR